MYVVYIAMISNRSRKSTARTVRLLGLGTRTLGRAILGHLPGGTEMERRTQQWAKAGEDWAETLEKMRGAAMKLGQMASQYSDLLPVEFRDKLTRLQKDVEPVPFTEIVKCLDQEWSARQHRQIKEIDPVAIAAASIGQVHRARLADGQSVVIKIRYPGIGETIDADLDQIRRILGLSRLLRMDRTSINQLLSELQARFREETDYRRELENLLLLRRDCATHGIVYPVPYPELCTPGILVMSEESGEPLDSACHWPQRLRDKLGTCLLTWLSHSVFIARATHADPHPGNFAFRRNGDIVIYDFGCVKRVPQDISVALSQVLASARVEDWEALHQILIRLGGIAEQAPGAVQLASLYAEISERVLKPVFSGNRFDFSEASYFADIRSSLGRHLDQTIHFKPISDLVFVTRALNGIYWILRELECRVAVGQVIQADAQRCANMNSPKVGNRDDD